MAKMTLLEMVQDILSDMDADEVNSINDTVEAVQVAQIIKTCYFEMLSNRNWPHTRKLVQMDSSGDVGKPNYLKLPENLKQLEFIKYEVKKSLAAKSELKELTYKEPDAFLRLVSNRDSLKATTTTVTDFSGTKLLIANDVQPTYWTSFDDVYLVTDSFYSVLDTTLQSAKTQCLAYLYPSWTKADSFIPDLPVDAFSALLEESKSTAFITLKQMANQKAEQKATRQQRWLSRKAWRAHGGVSYADFGRKGRR
jgi:hypothetical protein